MASVSTRRPSMLEGFKEVFLKVEIERHSSMDQQIFRSNFNRACISRMGRPGCKETKVGLSEGFIGFLSIGIFSCCGQSIRKESETLLAGVCNILGFFFDGADFSVSSFMRRFEGPHA
jgi:hypothetical protein